MRRISGLQAGAGLCAALAVGSVPAGAWAWGATGHRLIGQAAMLALPPGLPGFLHTPSAVEVVGEVAREPDRSKGAGAPHDHDLDPGHYLDLDDAGRVSGGPSLDGLPPDREGYDAALQTVGSDAYKSGYLPYNIEDGFEQVAKDFAYWRVETAALKTMTAPADRAWVARDRAEREELTLRDIGYWAHFVGDASQPLHVSVHHNGWGPYPNPKGYSDDKLHGPIEGPYVHDHLTLAGVSAAMAPPAACAPIQACTAAYLKATTAEVEPLYALWGAGGFARADAATTRFITDRVAAGAAKLRDMIAAAWTLSADETVGYQPEITPRAAEAGQPVPMDALYGRD